MQRTSPTTHESGGDGGSPAVDVTNSLLGELSTALAHHVRNAAASISANAELVLDLLEVQDPRRSAVERIVQETDRLERLVLHVLGAPTERKALLAPLDLREVIREVAREASVSLDLSGGKTPVLGDVGWLREALSSLFPVATEPSGSRAVTAVIDTVGARVRLALTRIRDGDVDPEEKALTDVLGLLRARCLLLGQGGDLRLSETDRGVTATLTLPALEATT